MCVWGERRGLLRLGEGREIWEGRCLGEGRVGGLNGNQLAGLD